LFVQVKSLDVWAEQIHAEMNNQTPVRNVSDVTERQKRHLEIKSEIDSRENTFASVVESGKTMIANGHFSAADVCNNCITLPAPTPNLLLTLNI